METTSTIAVEAMTLVATAVETSNRVVVSTTIMVDAVEDLTTIAADLCRIVNRVAQKAVTCKR